jgi:hypothetical protein
MTLLFTIIGIISFAAIGYRFATRVLSKEPVADRVK